MEALVVLIEKLPVWFLVSLIIIVVIVAVFYIPRLRRDKNGRWYIYSGKYEDTKRDMKKILGGMDENKKATTRLELLRAFDHEADNPKLICDLYDKYKSIGGNSEIDQKFFDWKRSRERKVS